MSDQTQDVGTEGVQGGEDGERRAGPATRAALRPDTQGEADSARAKTPAAPTPTGPRAHETMSTETEQREATAEVLDQLELDETVLSAVRVVVAQHLAERFSWAVRGGLGVGIITQLESRVLRHALAEYAAKHAGRLAYPAATPTPESEDR